MIGWEWICQSDCGSVNLTVVRQTDCVSAVWLWFCQSDCGCIRLTVVLSVSFIGGYEHISACSKKHLIVNSTQVLKMEIHWWISPWSSGPLVLWWPGLNTQSYTWSSGLYNGNSIEIFTLYSRPEIHYYNWIGVPIWLYLKLRLGDANILWGSLETCQWMSAVFYRWGWMYCNKSHLGSCCISNIYSGQVSGLQFD